MGTAENRPRMAPVALVVLLSLPIGCRHAGPTVGDNCRPLSGMSIRYFGDSHAAFCEAMSQRDGRAARMERLDRCARNLRASISTSSNDAARGDAYACPLFRSTLGDLLMGGDQPAKDEAFTLYQRSVDEESGAPEWIPGWIGMAAWATDRISMSAENAGRASFYLDSASEQLQKLIDAGKTRPALRPFGGMFPIAQLGAVDKPDPNDASATPDERRRLIWNWLLANEQWWEPAWGRPPGASEPPPAADSLRGLERRLRARIAYQRSLIRVARGEPPEVVRATLKEYRSAEDQKLSGALDWDPNFWPAHLLMARLLRTEGSFKEAEAPLAHYLRQPGSLLGGHPRLMLELGLIYVGWYARDRREDTLLAAAAALKAVTTTLDPYLGEAWLATAQLQAMAATHETDLTGEQRRALLADAIAALDAARRVGVEEKLLESAREVIRGAQNVSGG